MNRKKPRGRAFSKGASNPANDRYQKPKSDANSLANLRYDDAEFKEVREMDDQAYPFELETCPSKDDLSGDRKAK